MDINRSICDILYEKATSYFGSERVFKVGICVCLNKTVYDPIPEFIEFLNNCVKEIGWITYDMHNNHPLGICANIKLKSGITIAQVLQC